MRARRNNGGRHAAVWPLLPGSFGEGAMVPLTPHQLPGRPGTDDAALRSLLGAGAGPFSLALVSSRQPSAGGSVTMCPGYFCPVRLPHSFVSTVELTRSELEGTALLVPVSVFSLTCKSLAFH